jgi:hypothetical protein
VVNNPSFQDLSIGVWILKVSLERPIRLVRDYQNHLGQRTSFVSFNQVRTSGRNFSYTDRGP